MPFTNETMKAIEEASVLRSETTASAQNNIEYEDLSADRVRQAVLSTRQDVILLCSLLTDTHDQLVRIKRRVGIGLILIALAIVFS